MTGTETPMSQAEPPTATGVELEGRFLRLEQELCSARRSLRVLRGWVVAAPVAALLLGWVAPAMTQNRPAIPVAKLTAPFQVVDRTGRLMLIVESGKPGAYLQLFDSAGKPAVVLGNGDRGGGKITVYDRTGKPAFTAPESKP